MRAVERLEWIEDPARLAAVAPEWDALARLEETPFLLSAWILAWWSAFAPGRGLRVGVLWRDGKLVAGLPLQDRRGRWEAPVKEALPPLFGMLAADTAAGERMAALTLAAAPPETLLRALPVEGATVELMLAAARERGCRTLVEPMPPSPLVDTAGSFEDYQRERLSSKVRSEVGRLRRKSEREHRLEMSALEVPHDVEAQWARALELEAAGWKGRTGTAIVRLPEVRAFFARLTPELHAAGALRLSELWLDGALAAMAWSIVHRDRVFTLKVAYDERHRRLGPGFVLLMAKIERCFELGFRSYEFSGTEEDYERRFATGERARCRLRIHQPGPAGASMHVYRRRVRPALQAVRARARAIGGGEAGG